MWSVLSAVNAVNLVNTVNAVKYTPPPGGVARCPRDTSACGGREWGLDGIDLIDGIDGIDRGRC
jgi:hypothetical protein